MGKKIHDTTGDSLILRGSVWHARFQVNGITVAKSTKTSDRRQAVRMVAKWRSELVQQVVLEGKKPIKLHDAIDAFCKSRQHMPSGRNCEIHLRYFKDAPNHNLDRITDSELEAVVQKKRADGYKETTLKVSVSYFNAMIKYCDEHGYTVRKKMKPIKAQSQKLVWLSKDELQRLWTALDPALGVDEIAKAQKQENFDLAKLLYLTGGRYSELAEMKWSQVDIEKGTVLMLRKKGSISNTIKMDAEMKAIFERRRKLDKGEWVFATKQGRQHNETAWMQSAVRRAGLSHPGGSITLHSLRHSRAVHLLQSGLGLLELQRYFGHSTIASTIVYSHVVEDAVMDKVVELTSSH